MIEKCKYCGREHETDAGVPNMKVCPMIPRNEIWAFNPSKYPRIELSDAYYGNLGFDSTREFTPQPTTAAETTKDTNPTT
jgi:hypothetical protein